LSRVAEGTNGATPFRRHNVDNTVRLKIAPNSFSRISRRRNPRWSEHFDLEYVPAGFATAACWTGRF
jgi:hypothetical protein